MLVPVLVLVLRPARAPVRVLGLVLDLVLDLARVLDWAVDVETPHLRGPVACLSLRALRDVTWSALDLSFLVALLFCCCSWRVGVKGWEW